MELQNHWNNFLNVTGSLDNVIAFGEQLKKAQDSNGNESYTNLNRTIDLENVSYGYNGENVINNLNLVIDSKSTVAFVGESGSGKTTLVNLIVGLFYPDSGEVKIDGVNIKNLKKETYQSKIGYISQDPVIFNDSIFNNISGWAEKTPENINRFWNALEKAAIEDFVRTLPEQEKTLLGNNGIQVSGGQKQRLAIARELYKNIDILVMDEATSALDSETEKIIQENIDHLKGKLTILIIAHRLSTIKTSDKIILLKNGEIEDQGSYRELISGSKRFNKMVQMQEI